MYIYTYIYIILYRYRYHLFKFIINPGFLVPHLYLLGLPFRISELLFLGFFYSHVDVSDIEYTHVLFSVTAYTFIRNIELVKLK